MSKVYFHTADKKARLRSAFSVKILIEEIFAIEGKALKRLDYIFCSDDYLLKINQQYLKHNSLTDIITFQLSGLSKPVEGEIYISIDRVKENANLFCTSYQNEILRVIIHGALHLCGHKDKSESQKKKMRKKEDHYLNTFKISREKSN